MLVSSKYLLTLSVLLLTSLDTQPPLLAKPLNESPTITNDTHGPRNGHLFLHGGGRGKGSTDCIPLVVELASQNLKPGQNLNAVVIVTADADYDASILNWLKKQLASRYLLGIGRHLTVKILHTRSRKEANTKSFCEPLTNAHLVMISGGLTRLLKETYVNTRVETELHNLLKRGGVIAGGSAGAIIQASMMSRPTAGHDCFGFLTNSMVDVHVTERNRRNDLLRTLRKRKFKSKDLLGIGLDEAMAIHIAYDKLTVIGNKNVFIYDPRRWADKKPTYQTLSGGDQYDLIERKMISKQPSQ